MDLSNAKLGEVYSMYLNMDGIYNKVESVIQDSTVIAINNQGPGVLYHVLLGWKKGDEPVCEHERTFELTSTTIATTQKNASSCVPNLHNCCKALWVRREHIVHRLLGIHVALLWASTAVTKQISKECPCGIFPGDCTYHKDPS